MRGDKDDPFSRGYICPKAYGLKELYHDPDRLRRPVRRTRDGWEEIGWDEALRRSRRRALLAIREQYGNDAIGMYTGQSRRARPRRAALPPGARARARAARSLFNSSAIDTLAEDRPDRPDVRSARSRPACPCPTSTARSYLLIIGANPVVSHGSLMTMPDAPGRLKAVIERGGKLVVIDPRRTETAKIASEHHFIRPGTDAAFLLALVHTLFDEELVELGAAEGLVAGLDAVEAGRASSRPKRSPSYCGIPAAEIRRIAREHGRGGVGRVLRPARHLRAGVRHARELGLRPRQRPDRQPRPRRAA